MEEERWIFHAEISYNLCKYPSSSRKWSISPHPLSMHSSDFLSKGEACGLSHVRPTVTPQTVAHQALLSMKFSRQEYWSGLPFPPPGDLPHPGMEPTSLVSPVLAGGFFTTEPPGKPRAKCGRKQKYLSVEKPGKPQPGAQWQHQRS